MKVLWVTCMILVMLTIASCNKNDVRSETVADLVFSNIESDYKLTDVNHYDCTEINSTVISHILKYGTFVSEPELHDFYSTTGCTVQGRLKVNGELLEFTYDYGGIMYFNNGKTIACGEGCCRDDYPYCSWDKENLNGG
jgi:hypothetical protein